MAMATDDLMVYSGMAIVPALASLACFLTLLAVRRRAMSAAVSCLVFIAAVPAGMALSYFFVSSFSYLLHGDGALAVVAAPVTGAILSVPVALVYAVALAVILSRRAVQ